MTKVKNIFFRNSIGEIFAWIEILVYSGTKEFTKITQFEPTIAPLKGLQCKLTGQIKSSCQLLSIITSSTLSINAIHGQMRRLEKRWKCAVGNNRASDGVFDSNFSGNEAEACKEDVNH